ncbi:MAG: hypothetical protein D6788_08540 [Planctomycetota bacterium]|nr:MAG: hypothetical protein D6788_08540 [Planctomycetota bacterium]
MADMTGMQRLRAVLEGERPDHPPVSFWHHFSPEERYGPAAVSAHLRHLETFGVDFLKVMNDNPYPSAFVLRGVSDLRRLRELEGDEEGFARQLDLLRDLRAKVGREVPLITTVFNPWAVLRRLTREPGTIKHGPPDLSGRLAEPDRLLSRWLAEDRDAVRQAVAAVGASLARFARRCIEAGADGIFLSVRDDWVDTEANGPDTYDEIIREADLNILASAAAGWCNMLHVCGRPRNFERFAAYPAAILNWADRVGGPAIGEVAGKVKPALCGGVDNLHTLPDGKPEDVRAEVIDARQQAGNHPFLVGPGCTYDPQRVPPENLHAMVAAARES